MIFLPFAVPEMKASTRETVRLKTPTSNPLLSMFSARFSPITANPMSPISAAKSVSSYDSVHFAYHTLQKTMMSTEKSKAFSFRLSAVSKVVGVYGLGIQNLNKKWKTMVKPKNM